MGSRTTLIQVNPPEVDCFFTDGNSVEAGGIFGGLFNLDSH